MSKFELQERTLTASGVSYEESLEATRLQPCLYDRIGEESGFQHLSQLFYDSVYDNNQNQSPNSSTNDDDWFRSIFSSSTKQEAIDNQYRFLVQAFGGPNLYQQKKGRRTRLVGRHANYRIGVPAADRWVRHMQDAMERHEVLCQDHEARHALLNYFKYTAHYIVVTSDYMRRDQLSGGTQMDEGRVW